MSGIPINSGTGPSVAATLSGTDYIQLVSIANAPTVTVSNTLSFTASGTQMVNVVAATNFTIATGTMNVVNVLSAANVTVASVTTGTMHVVNTVTITGTVGALMLQKLDNTNDNILIYGAQTGSSINQAVAVTTTGAQYVLFTTTQAVTAANVTIASVTTGTMNVVNVLSAANVTIASITTGTVSIVGAPLMLYQPSTSGNVTGNTVVTNSTNAIVITSGANTICITDLLISVDVPMNVTLFSAATTKMGPLYFATKGGMALSFTSPLKMNSNQSLTFTPSLTGSCTVFAGGFSTV